jgi:hypothetical protein
MVLNNLCKIAKVLGLTLLSDKMKIPFGVIIIMLWAFELLSSLTRGGVILVRMDTVVQMNLIIESVINFIIALFFIVTGIRMRRVIRQTLSQDVSRVRTTAYGHSIGDPLPGNISNF